MNDRVHNGSLDVDLVDLLSGVVVLYTLSLSLDNRLDFLNDVLVDMLSDDRSVDGGRVSLISDSLLVSVLSLGAVFCAVLFGDVFVDVARDMRSDVLVMSVELLLVEDWLDLLMNLSLVSLSVYDRCDFVMSVLQDVLVYYSIEHVSCVSTADSIIYNVL